MQPPFRDTSINRWLVQNSLHHQFPRIKDQPRVVAQGSKSQNQPPLPWHRGPILHRRPRLGQGVQNRVNSQHPQTHPQRSPLLPPRKTSLKEKQVPQKEHQPKKGDLFSAQSPQNQPRSHHSPPQNSPPRLRFQGPKRPQPSQQSKETRQTIRSPRNIRHRRAVHGVNGPNQRHQQSQSVGLFFTIHSTLPCNQFPKNAPG